MKNNTKKRFALMIAAIMLMLVPTAVFAGASGLTGSSDAITVTVDGQVVYFPDQEPILVDGTTLVPVRGVFEHIGFEVGWDHDTATATLTRGHFHITVTIGESTFGVLVYDPESPFPGHGSIVALEVPAQLIGGRTMLPLRAVLESVGYSFDWDGQARTVLITSPALPMIFTIEEYDGPSAMALELLYYDEFTRYYLSSMRSLSIMLEFEDGTRMSLREALDTQKVTMADLMFNGLEVIQKPVSPEPRPEHSIT